LRFKGNSDQSRIFTHDAGQIVLDFEKTGTGDAANGDLSHRYLWGTAVDQILADEAVDDGTADDVAWTLTDHLNSVRDLVECDRGSDTASVIKHVTYDAFGNLTSDSASSVESLFLFTARPYDDDAQLQNNLNRWYDPATGRWMSVDPIGFQAGDANLYRYVGNTSTNKTDPSGLDPMSPDSQPTAEAGVQRELVNAVPGFNGKFRVEWRFRLSGTYDYTVALIQKVEVKVKVSGVPAPPNWETVGVRKKTYFEVIGFIA
jgi:RHS repeat-associated protein